MAYLARRMQVLDEERSTLAAALDMLQAPPSAHADGGNGETKTDKVGDGVGVFTAEKVGTTESMSEALLQACKVPLFQ